MLSGFSFLENKNKNKNSWSFTGSGVKKSIGLYHITEEKAEYNHSKNTHRQSVSLVSQTQEAFFFI
jgi:hypothetical protein